MATSPPVKYWPNGANGGNGQFPPFYAPLVPPIDAGFAWVNQAGASVIALPEALYLTTEEPPVSAGWRLRVQAAPGSPFVVTLAYIPQLLNRTGGGNQCGLVVRDSGLGEFRIFALSDMFNADYFAHISLYTSPTASTNLFVSSTMVPHSPVWVQFEDDGLTWTYRWSSTGRAWSTFFSEPVPGGFAIDEIGFGVAADSALLPWAPGITVISWEVLP